MHILAPIHRLSYNHPLTCMLFNHTLIPSLYRTVSYSLVHCIISYTILFQSGSYSYLPVHSYSRAFSAHWHALNLPAHIRTKLDFHTHLLSYSHISTIIRSLMHSLWWFGLMMRDPKSKWAYRTCLKGSVLFHTLYKVTTGAAQQVSCTETWLIQLRS